ncbi:MAG TPA: adenylate kinase [Methanomassiliicoccales archaeon]|jgi:adenylate kinase
MDLKIVLLGPPGSGKGTQTERLCAELKFTKISTGDLLREAVKLGTPLGVKAKSFMESGGLVPDQLVGDLIKEKLTGLQGGVILDGFPRTVEQAKMLDQIITVDMAIDLEVDEELLVKRLTERRVCKSCNSVFHLEFNPPKVAGKCDKCGSELIQRNDDSEKVVRERLRVYKEKTLPLTRYYYDKQILVRIDGQGEIGDVYARILKALRSHKTK